MLTFRRLFIANRVCHNFNQAICGLSSTENVVATPVGHQLRSALSRSRPPPAVHISRLPARGPSSTRTFSSLPTLTEEEVQRKVEDISEKFKEAMELLDDARGSVGTVYFSDDMTDAENAIQEVLSDYDNLMTQMNESQKRSVVRTIGLKIEELKAQVQMLKESLKE